MQVMFPMFQELAPHDPHDKCGHHYAICLDLKNQRVEVLDSIRSEDDLDLLNSSLRTSKRYGTVTMNTQRSRSGISRLSMWRLRSKGTRNLFHPFPYASYINPIPVFVLSDLKLKYVFLLRLCSLCGHVILSSSCRTDCGFH